MKKMFFTSVISLLTFSGYNQSNPPASKIDHQYEKDQFLIKAKKQKTAAWVCLGGGILLFTTGAVAGAAKVTEDLFVSFATLESTQQDYTSESIQMLAGAAGIVASIPLFIASGNSRHKARLLVTSQQAAFISPLAVSKKVTGLTLSMSL